MVIRPDFLARGSELGARRLLGDFVCGNPEPKTQLRCASGQLLLCLAILPSRLYHRQKMSGTQAPRSLFFAVLLAAIAQCVHDFPLLPVRMASHFAASGMPNGWMTKSQFFIVYAVVLVPALVVEFWVGTRISKKPDAQLRLPNKEYWLAPERRAETFAYFRSFFAWYGCAFLVIELLTMGMAMRANFETPPKLPTAPIVSALAGFIFFNIAAVIAVLRRFSTVR